MRVKLHHICLVFLIFLFAGSVGATKVDLCEKESGKGIILHKGDLLVVKLSSNRTTGYAWNLLLVPHGVLEQVGESRYSISKSDKDLLGSGGVEIWIFHAVSPGVTQLKFSYARPWEKGVPPARLLVWPVQVQP